MLSCMEQWNLDPMNIKTVFLTHSHFDHAGNVWRMNQLGADVLASAEDAEKIEHGNPEMEQLFGSPWKCGRITRTIREGDSFTFGGQVETMCWKRRDTAKALFPF